MLSKRAPTSAPSPPASQAASPGAAAPEREEWDILRVLEEANQIASMTTLNDLLEQMLDLMIRVSGATNGSLYLHEPLSHELVFMVVRGSPEDMRLKGRRIKETMGIVGVAIQQATPIVINDLANDPRWYREFTPELAQRLRNVITLPLLMGAKPIGAVQIFNFTHARVELLQILGSRMASEVDKTLLLEKTQRSNQRLQALVDVLGQVGAVLDRDQLLALLTRHTADLLHAENSSVYLVEDSESGAQLLTRCHPAETCRETHPALPIAGQLSRQQSKGFQANSVVSAPLRARPIVLGKERSLLEERIIGELMAFNKPRGEFDAEDIQLMEILASQTSTVLQIATLYGQASQLFLEFIQALAAAIDAKDAYTRGHSQRVSDYTVGIAVQMGIQGDALMDLRIGSLLHDIGKLGVPDLILGKPGKLTDEEFEQIKKHPGRGYKILKEVQMLRNILPAVLEHHERVDGTGYPMGLHGEQISQMGRIVAVADVYDALTTDRPYRKAMNLEEALDYLHKNINVQFDGMCVDALTRHLLQTPPASKA